MTLTAGIGFGLLVVCATAARSAGHAHEHGVAKLDIAVEAGRLTIELDSPQDNLLGFERAPRTAAERKAADAAVARLRTAQLMFVIDPAAGCTLDTVELSSAALKLGHPDRKEEEEGHADIDGNFEFKCADATRATFIDVGLFGFARLQRLEVQVATPRGQFKRELKRPAKRIVLTR